FMEMNTAAARELAVQLGLNFTTSTFGFGVGGSSGSGASLNPFLLTSAPGFTGLTPVGIGPQTVFQNPFGANLTNGSVSNIGGNGQGYSVQPVNFPSRH